MDTLIEDDKPLMDEYKIFNKMLSDCIEEEEERSKWIIRLVLDREAMLDKNITMDDIHFAIQNSYKENVILYLFRF